MSYRNFNFQSFAGGWPLFTQLVFDWLLVKMRSYYHSSFTSIAAGQIYCSDYFTHLPRLVDLFVPIFSSF